MSASSYHQRDIILCLCPYQTKLTVMLLSTLTCLFCFYPWPYILNVWTCSCETADVFNETAHVFCNLFWQICPLFGQILITCLKCFRAFFSPFFIAKRFPSKYNLNFPLLVCIKFLKKFESTITDEDRKSQPTLTKKLKEACNKKINSKDNRFVSTIITLIDSLKNSCI